MGHAFLKTKNTGLGDAFQKRRAILLEKLRGSHPFREYEYATELTLLLPIDQSAWWQVFTHNLGRVMPPNTWCFYAPQSQNTGVKYDPGSIRENRKFPSWNSHFSDTTASCQWGVLYYSEPVVGLTEPGVYLCNGRGPSCREQRALCVDSSGSVYCVLGDTGCCILQQSSRFCSAC